MPSKILPNFFSHITLNDVGKLPDSKAQHSSITLYNFRGSANFSFSSSQSHLFEIQVATVLIGLLSIF